jgi:hypothetical protein
VWTVEVAAREADMPDPKDEYDVLIALKRKPTNEVEIAWVEYAGRPRIYEPTGELRKDPIVDVDILGVEVFDVIVYLERTNGAIMMCVHKYCRRYC